MYFESFSAFLQMGQHGYYVWLAYGLSFLLLFGLVMYSRLNRLTTIKQIRRLQRRSDVVNDHRPNPAG